MTEKKHNNLEKKTKKSNNNKIFWRVILGFFIFVKDLIIGLFIALLSLGTIFLVFIYVVYLNYAKEFRNARVRSNSTKNIVYDKNLGIIYEGFGASSPDVIEIGEVPELIKQATLASEDPNFYKHGAIDPKGIARAAYVNLIQSEKDGFNKFSDLFEENNYVQGGSSITQQLVKNIYLTNEKSFDRKIKEVIYAFEFEKLKTKDEILEEYLNSVYYGEQSLGIKNASRRYFKKDISELDLAEASLLAGLPVSPSRLSPISGDYQEAKKRQEYVLSKMVGSGYITIEEAKMAANQPLYFDFNEEEPLKTHPYYVDYVIEEARGIIGEENLDAGGYTIYTYLDSEKQGIAESVSSEYIDKFVARKVTNAAVVILDNSEPEIIAMVGGVDYEKSKFNVATAERQPGSSFKPLVYLTGFLNGYSPATRLVDKSVNFGGIPPYIPKNYDGSYHGNITARYALANSLNIPAVEMARLVGIEKIIETAQKLGIKSIKKNKSDYGLSLALGSAEVSLLELSRAYSVLANNGQLGNFSSIEKIVDASGNIIYKHQKYREEVVDSRAGYILTSILTDNQARSMIFGSNSPLFLKDRKVAAKTGTTDDYADSWTMGYTPQFTVGVWMGNNDRSKMARVSGVEGAAYIWHDIIQKIHAGLPAEDFIRPDDISETWVNPFSGLRANSHSKPNILELFIPGTEPAEKPDFSYLNQFYR